MTVVVMSLLWDSEKREPRHVLAASDKLLSASAASIHLPYPKIQLISKTWLIGYAGLPTHFFPISNALVAAVGGHRSSVETVEAAQKVYQQYRERLVNAQVLSPYGMTLDTFKTDGITAFGHRTFERIRREILDFDPNISILLGGWGPDTLWDPRLTVIANPGVIYEHAVAGSAAIGSGAAIALGHLYACHRYGDTLEAARYRILEAKLMSEAARTVGPETALLNVNLDGTFEGVTNSDCERFRKLWERRRRETPRRVLNALRPRVIPPRAATPQP